MGETSTHIHEQDFCAEVASAAKVIFASDLTSPFADARIEGYGSGAQKRKRKDLRIFGKGGKLALTGEVKLPGTIEGRSPYDGDVVQDAQTKADNANVQYFFTWNVNTFVLWDRYRQDVPLLERRVREWTSARYFRSPDDVGRPENLKYITDEFLPGVLSEVGEIFSGRLTNWEMAPDDIFIRSLESHLAWPADLTRVYLAEQAEKSRAFDSRLQQWMAAQSWQFVRGTAELWAEALDRAARTVVYVLANRLIFYQALRARFPDLPVLRVRGKTPAETYSALQRTFERAVERTGDYEPLFYPHERDDWAGPLIFAHPQAADAWRGALRGIESYDFSHISSDIIGRIFQRLISPEERHRWGQHFTGDDVVDFINAFCIRGANDKILDPACGSGSFLVRAYYRKQHLKINKSHVELLSELFGSDIALYPAHLATLNLAAREIRDEVNYPRIVRKNFFEITQEKPFCSLPNGDDTVDIVLPQLDAIVGNPPYVRQEKIGKDTKTKIGQLIAGRWPGIKLSGRSDLHCYFWPAAAYFLKEGGYFGFLTSSSWLDVEYGFPLQRWILENFAIVAVCESDAEPWFEDARVKTCATILRRCKDRAARMNSLVRFVKFKRPLAELIGPAPDNIERFGAIDALRQRIETTTEFCEDRTLRIILKRQGDLWEDGVRTGKMLSGTATTLQVEDETDGGDEFEEDDTADLTEAPDLSEYVAGKWGRYVRAPDYYFDILREFGSRFIALGSIAEVRFGVKTGCDAFFMPHEITASALTNFKTNAEFKRRFGLDRHLVEAGTVRIIRAGDGSEHPIEDEYLKPELHSPMIIERPIVHTADLDRLVLLVGKSQSALKGTWVGRYLRYGETQTFASGKSKPVPVPKRSTCAARDPWFDLTKLVKPGFAFWPKAQQYRHIIAYNPERLICNCNLYDLSSEMLSNGEIEVLVGILNSTLVGFFKTFYGRFAGTEGDLKTEIIDVNMLDVPDPRHATPNVSNRIREAFARLRERVTGRLVEEDLMECHSPEKADSIAAGPVKLADELTRSDRRELDDAVFELLGITSSERRHQLVDRLYEETAQHFRQIRVVEIQKQEQRTKAGTRRFTTRDLASDAWDAAELSDRLTLTRWLDGQAADGTAFTIPDGNVSLASASDMYDGTAVYFGRGREAKRIVCESRPQAELLATIASVGMKGITRLPKSEKACRDLLARLEDRLKDAHAKFNELAQSRSDDAKSQKEIVDLLMHWFIHGQEPGRTEQSAANHD